MTLWAWGERVRVAWVSWGVWEPEGSVYGWVCVEGCLVDLRLWCGVL